MLAIFSYGFEIANTNFNNENVTLHTLSNYEALLDEALETNYITKEQLKTLSIWNANPSKWNTI